jgi:hypothetical protein
MNEEDREGEEMGVEDRSEEERNVGGKRIV